MADLKDQAKKKKDERRDVPAWMRRMFGVKGYEAKERETHKQAEEKKEKRPDSYVLDEPKVKDEPEKPDKDKPIRKRRR